MRVAFYKAEFGTFYDKFIAGITRGPYSHCELVFENGQWFSSSPRDSGVRFKNIIDYQNHWHYIHTDLNSKQEDVVWAWCLSMVGAKYDWFGSVHLILPIFKPSSERWFCSEICICALQEAGLLMNIKNPHHISPNKLYEIMTT